MCGENGDPGVQPLDPEAIRTMIAEAQKLEPDQIYVINVYGQPFSVVQRLTANLRADKAFIKMQNPDARAPVFFAHNYTSARFVSLGSEGDLAERLFDVLDLHNVPDQVAVLHDILGILIPASAGS